MTETKKRKKKTVETILPDPTPLFNPDYLETIGFDFDWLQKLADEYKFDKFEYVHKFRAFRCYQKNVHVEWIDVNMLAVKNGKRQLCEIMMKHQPLGKHRKIIYLPWE
tara:strand:+ start:2651 stop:2974 length:324 start_codon:yes stop_codon:yes gene_type:complete